MRTKLAILTASIMVAGLGASQAQVYSVNAVGYVNVPVVAGYQCLANPLNNSNNLCSQVLPDPAPGTRIYRFDTGSQTYSAPATFVVDNEEVPPLKFWSGDTTIAPGEAFFCFSPIPTNLTFVGEVPQGNLTNSIPSNYSLRSSIVPQQAPLSALGYVPQAGDRVYFFSSGAWLAPRTYVVDNEEVPPLAFWSGGEPTPAVAQGFFLFNGGSLRPWTRTFSVN